MLGAETLVDRRAHAIAGADSAWYGSRSAASPDLSPGQSGQTTPTNTRSTSVAVGE